MGDFDHEFGALPTTYPVPYMVETQKVRVRFPSVPDGTRAGTSCHVQDQRRADVSPFFYRCSKEWKLGLAVMYQLWQRRDKYEFVFYRVLKEWKLGPAVMYQLWQRRDKYEFVFYRVRFFFIGSLNNGSWDWL